MHFEYRTLFSVPEYIPQEALEQLGFDGIHLNRQSGQKLTQRVIELNKLISDRINNCKSIFPEWLNWNYIRDLFIMKDGDDMLMLGTTNGMLREVSDITMSPTDAIVWEATIEAASWTFVKDDGQVAS